MSTPVRAADSPFAVPVEQGKDYWWCACGLSKSQPFCDGSHKATDLRPMQFTASATETVYLCGCKGTGAPPFCDGSHKKP